MAMYSPSYRHHKDDHIHSRHRLMLLACSEPQRIGISKSMTSPSYPKKKANSRPLHFINSDVDTFGVQDARRRTRDVKSYLSGHYRRWKRQQTLGPQSTAPNEQGALEQRDTVLVPQPQPRPQPRRRNEPQRPLLALKPPRAIKDTADETQAEDQPETNLSVVPRPANLQHTLNYGNSDPFGTFPVPIDARTSMHIRLFQTGTNVMCWTTQVDRRLKNMLHNEALMHGILAISKVIAAVYLPVKHNNIVLVPESRQHYGRLLRLMRIHFQNRANQDADVSIEMMHAAMMFTFLSRQYDEFDIHLQGLKSLITSLGGPKAISPAHFGRFLNAEQLRALFLLKKPLVPMEEWAPRSWLEEPKFRPYDQIYNRIWASLSSDDIPVLPEGVFSQRVRALMLDFRDFMAVGGVGAMLHQTKQADVDIFGRWIAPRSHALAIQAADILSDIMEVKQSAPSIELSLQASACLAASCTPHILRSAQNPTLGLSYVPFASLTQMLREVDEQIQEDTPVHYLQLYLWALFAGACAEVASRTWSCDPAFRGSSWCSSKLAQILEKLNIDTLADFRSNLRHYFVPSLLESYMAVLFEKRHELVTL